MKISVQVKANSKTEKIEKISDTEYIVRVHAPPTENKANRRVIELLAEYFDCAPSLIEFVAGQKSKKKVLKIR